MIEVGSRAQVPAYTDAWMRGDRYEGVTDAIRKPERVAVWVKLDTSRRTLECELDDRTEV